MLSKQEELKRERNARIALLMQELDAEADALINQAPVMSVHGTIFDHGDKGSHPESGDLGSTASMANVGPSADGAAPVDGNELTLTLPSSEQSLSTSIVHTSSSFIVTGGARRQSRSTPSSAKVAQVMTRAVARKRSMMLQVLVALSTFVEALDYRRRVVKMKALLERVFLRRIRQRRRLLAKEKELECAAGTADKRNAQAGLTAAKEKEVWKPTAAELQHLDPLFASCGPVQLDERVDALEKKEFVKDDIVWSAGDTAISIYIIGRGEVAEKMFRKDSSRSESTMRRFGAKSMVGDIFNTPLGYESTVVAEVATVAWKLSKRRADEIFLSGTGMPEAKACYLQHLKAAYLAVFKEAFPLVGAERKVPILRSIDRGVMAKHWPRLEPVVYSKGDVLFTAGSNASAVYLLTDGEVERIVPASSDGPEMSQILCVNRGGAPKNGRYALLGDEPHILPEKHRYTCRVATDIAGCYRMPGAVFMDMLLDDAKLYLSVRAELLKRRAKKMKLRSKEDALKQIPLLSLFPPSRIQALIPQLTAVCVERSASLCQSQQPLKELFLVVKGELRDPRDPATAPKALPRPHVESPNKQQAAASSGGFLSRQTRSLSTTSLLGNTTNNASSNKLHRTLSGAGESSSALLGTVAVLSGNQQRREYCSDSDDLNPMLPAVIAYGFASALGGDFEGLLYDKWNATWETTTVVEMWTLPSYAIRAEFNEIVRTHQMSILHELRVREATFLGLAEPRGTKLPPMSTYKQYQPQLMQQSQQQGNGKYGGLDQVAGGAAKNQGSRRQRMKVREGSTSNDNSESAASSSQVTSAENSQIESSTTSRPTNAAALSSTASRRSPKRHIVSQQGSPSATSKFKPVLATDDDEEHDEAEEVEEETAPADPIDPEALRRRQSVRRRDLEKLALKTRPLRDVINEHVKAMQAQAREIARASPTRAMTSDEEISRVRKEARLYLQGIDASATALVIREPEVHQSPQAGAVGRYGALSPMTVSQKQPPQVSQKQWLHSPTSPQPAAGGNKLVLREDEEPALPLGFLLSPKTRAAAQQHAASTTPVRKMPPSSPRDSASVMQQQQRPRWPSPPKTHRPWFSSGVPAVAPRFEAINVDPYPPMAAAERAKPTFDVSLKRVILAMEGRK